MQDTTRTAIIAILKGDPSVSVRRRKELTDAIDGKNDRSSSAAANPDLPLLIKQKDVAQMLSTSRQTVRALVRKGVLRPVCITAGAGKVRSGDLMRFRRVDIEALANNS